MVFNAQSTTTIISWRSSPENRNLKKNHIIIVSAKGTQFRRSAGLWKQKTKQNKQKTRKDDKVSFMQKMETHMRISKELWNIPFSNKSLAEERPKPPPLTDWPIPPPTPRFAAARQVSLLHTHRRRGKRKRKKEEKGTKVSASHALVHRIPR